MDDAYERQWKATEPKRLEEAAREAERTATLEVWNRAFSHLDRELRRDTKRFAVALRKARKRPDGQRHTTFGRSLPRWSIYGRGTTSMYESGPYFRIYACVDGHLYVGEDSSRHGGDSRIFTRAHPLDPPTADELREGMARRLVVEGVTLT